LRDAAIAGDQEKLGNQNTGSSLAQDYAEAAQRCFNLGAALTLALKSLQKQSDFAA